MSQLKSQKGAERVNEAYMLAPMRLGVQPVAPNLPRRTLRRQRFGAIAKDPARQGCW